MDKELYELCIEVNQEDIINHEFLKKCKPIENWIDKTIESIRKELGEKYNNDPQYRKMDIGEKGYLYFKEQINLFFKAMQAEEHKEIYIHKNSYNAICSYLASALCNGNQVIQEEIIKPNSLLKLNLYSFYEYWYEANTSITYCVTTDKIFANVLKKHNVSLEQITNIYWIIENRSIAKTVFTGIYKKNKKKIKDLENKNSNIIPQKKVLEAICYPLDKLNNLVWNCYNESFYKGNNDIEISIKISKKCPDIYVVFNVDFSNLENVKISDKKITPYEKRVYFTISNLFNTYKEIPYITLDDIGKSIYNTKKISKDQREKLLNAVRKLKDINIKIDNEEAIKHGYSMKKFKYEGRLLPVDVFTGENEKGQDIIKIVRLTAVTYTVSPLFDYMTNVIGQYTTFKSEVLKTPLTINNKNIALSDYLLRNIKWNSKSSDFHISLKSIYENTGLTEAIYKHDNKLKNLKRDKLLMLNDTKALLDYWITQELFKNYSIDEKNITIHNF